MELKGTVRSPPIDVVLMNSPLLFSLKCGIKAFVEIFLYDWWPIRAEARLSDRLAAMRYASGT